MYAGYKETQNCQLRPLLKQLNTQALGFFTGSYSYFLHLYY